MRKRKAKDWWTPYASAKARGEGWDLVTTAEGLLKVVKADNDVCSSEFEALIPVFTKADFSPFHKVAELLNGVHEDEEVSLPSGFYYAVLGEAAKSEAVQEER